MNDQPVGISMVDIVSEYHALNQARQKGLITLEQFNQGKELASKLAVICLSSQIGAYNEMCSRMEARRKEDTQTEVKE
jgi:hypothetical protein